MVVTSRRIPNPELPEAEKLKLLELPKYKPAGVSETQPFMFLSLDLPAKPLFVDPMKQISIPQVSRFLIPFFGLGCSGLPALLKQKIKFWNTLINRFLKIKDKCTRLTLATR